MFSELSNAVAVGIHCLGYRFPAVVIGALRRACIAVVRVDSFYLSVPIDFVLFVFPHGGGEGAHPQDVSPQPGHRVWADPAEARGEGQQDPHQPHAAYQYGRQLVTGGHVTGRAGLCLCPSVGPSACPLLSLSGSPSVPLYVPLSFLSISLYSCVSVSVPFRFLFTSLSLPFSLTHQRSVSPRSFSLLSFSPLSFLISTPSVSAFLRINSHSMVLSICG